MGESICKRQTDKGLNSQNTQRARAAQYKKNQKISRKPNRHFSKEDIQTAERPHEEMLNIPNCCCCSVTQSRLTLCNPMDCTTSSFPVLHYLPEFAQTHVHQVGDAIQPSHTLSSPSPPAFIFTSIRVFYNESDLHIRWPKYWSFSIYPSNEYSGLISFRIDWFDLMADQGTLKSLLPPQIKSTSSLAQTIDM